MDIITIKQQNVMIVYDPAMNERQYHITKHNTNTTYIKPTHIILTIRYTQLNIITIKHKM